MLPLIYIVSSAFAVGMVAALVVRYLLARHYKGQLRQHEIRIEQLERQTKTLGVVWSIEQLIVNTLDAAQLDDKIVTSIMVELERYGFFGSFLIQIDQERGRLATTASAVSSSASTTHVRQSVVQASSIALSNVNHPFVSALSTKELVITEKLDQLFGRFDEATVREIQHAGIKGAVAFPLVSQSTAFGLLLFLITKQSQEVSAYELSMLQGFANAATIALHNASLYAALSKTSHDLQIANEHLKELDKLKDEFVSLASHELRTPMTAIRGSLSTIIEGYAGDISPQTREFLTAAYNENDRLIRLVNNLLNISRIEAGRFKFEHKAFDYHKMVSEIVGNLQMAAKEKNLSLTFQGTTSQLTLVSDEDKIAEVLINLIGNAIKFTHQGGVTVRDVVEGNMLHVAVADTGSGITKEDQELLFKKFSQVGRDTYAKQTGGTGLGLYICKQIIEGLGGRIWLESDLGKGSTFHFTLPTTS